MIDVGGGAPATTILVIPAPGIGPSHSDAASKIAATTAGAPHISVTPCFSIRFSISFPSTFLSTT